MEPKLYAVSMEDGATVIGKSMLRLEDIGNKLVLEETLTLLTVPLMPVTDLRDPNFGEHLVDVLRTRYYAELNKKCNLGENRTKSGIQGSVYLNMEYVLRVQEI